MSVFLLKKPVKLDMTTLSLSLDQLDIILEGIWSQLVTIASETTLYLDNIKTEWFPDYDVTYDNPGVIFSAVCTTGPDILIQKMDIFKTEVILQLKNTVLSGIL